MALAGPPLPSKAVTGEEISMEDLGGAKVHCRKSASATSSSRTTECIERIKQYLSYFPVELRRSRRSSDTDPDDRMSEKLLEIVPESSRKPYDMVRR